MSAETASKLKENAQDLSSPEEDISKLLTGEILKRARVEKGLTIDQVSKHLLIKPVYIDALENGDFDRLPGHAYVVGFIKSYAQFLGLSSDEIVQTLKRQTGRTRVRPDYIFPVAAEDQRLPGRKTIIGSACALLLLVLTWNVVTGKSNQDGVPPVPKDLVEQMTPPKKPEPPATQQAIAAVPEPHPVVLKAVADSWIEIKDGAGKAIFSRVLKTGEEFWVPDDGQIHSMTTGNAGGLRLIVKGKELPPPGRVAEVKRHISLDPAKLSGANSVEKTR